MNLEKRLIEYWRKNHLSQTGAQVIVACSGGPDSLALLDMVHRLQATLRINVMAAHFEHGIRGDASKADAEFVQEYCVQRGIPFVMESADIPAICHTTGESLETGARRLRYAFLQKLANGYENAVIATAHHADDQAETVLMHLLRGSGIKGLSGIMPKRDNIIRPFLPFAKAELVAYCHEQKLAPRLDETNNEADCTRNKLRLELLPLLQNEYNNNIANNLCQLAETARAEDELLEKLCRQRADQLVSVNKDGTVSCSVRSFMAEPLAMQRRLIQHMAGLINEDLSFVHIEAFRQLIEADVTGSAIHLPGHCEGWLSYGIVYLSKNHRDFLENNGTIKDTKSEIKLEAFSEIALPAGGEMTAKLVDSLTEEQPFSKHHIYCDAAKSGSSVVVRYRKPGDRLRLSAGHKKLKDFFVDSKIERNCRDSVPIVLSSVTGEIIWVAGLRQTEAALADENTKQYLILSYREKE